MKEILNHKDIKSIVFSSEEIQARVAEMGEQITDDYAECVERGEEVVLITMLRGAAFFASDLSRHIKLPVILDYMKASSYGNATTTSGIVTIESDITTDVAGRHVIIIEDILDSGVTLNFMLKNMQIRDPLSVEVAIFLKKKNAPGNKLQCKYTGFECPDEFIVGYGLDYAGRYRNVPDVCILKPEVYGL